MNQDKKQNILNWFAKADEDLERVWEDIILFIKAKLQEPQISFSDRLLYATEILFKHDPNFVLNVIGFHCQQSVEKYLKAFLIFKEHDFDYKHNLNYLLNLCSDFDTEFKNIDVGNLSRFAVDQRYPDEAYEPNIEEASGYLEIAKAIKKLVRSKIVF